MQLKLVEVVALEEILEEEEMVHRNEDIPLGGIFVSLAKTLSKFMVGLGTGVNTTNFTKKLLCSIYES